MRAVIVASGEPDAADLRHLEGADLVLAADGGAHWLAAAGVTPAELIGDLDSVATAELDEVESSGMRVERHPVAKDASDLELAVDRARALGAQEIVIIGALHGDRPSHELANVLLLTRCDRGDCNIRIVRGDTTVRALRGPARLELSGAAGGLVSLLPISDATGVRTAGLRYPLDAEALLVGTSRGLSNEMLTTIAAIELDDGILLVVEEPEPGDPPDQD